MLDVVNYRLSYEEQRTKASLVKGRGTAKAVEGFAWKCIEFAVNQCEFATYYRESPRQKSEIFASPL